MHIVSILIILFTYSLFSLQKSNVTAHIELKGENNHSGIEITFEMIAPQKKNFIFKTNDSGDISEELEYGIYNVLVTKNGYSNIYVENRNINETAFHLGNWKIHKIFGGLMSGLIKKGIYFVEKDIVVDYGKTLVLEPGVELEFAYGVGTQINGDLIAKGTPSDQIIFKSQTSTRSELDFGIYDKNSIIEFDFVKIENCLFNFKLIQLDSRPTINIKNSTVSNNSTLFFYGPNSLSVNIIFENNSKPISVIGGSQEVYNSVFENGGFSNVTHSDWYSGNIFFENCLFSNNKGPMFTWGHCSLINCIFQNNQTNDLFSGTNGGYHIINSMFIGNIVGGDLINKNSLVYNSIFINNKMAKLADFCTDCGIYNSVVWNNSTDKVSGDFGEFYGEVFMVNDNGDSVDVYGNMFLDPDFGIANDDFKLDEQSICIDAGIDNDFISSTDYNGNDRKTDGRGNGENTIDIGPIEFSGASSIFDSDKDDLVKIFPNPITENSIITFTPKQFGNYEIAIFNLSGEKLLTLHSGVLSVEAHDFKVNQKTMTSGAYLLKIQSGNESISKLLIK
jgi:Secretion system C-terminal sorting domain